jgi:hypothetical protein
MGVITNGPLYEGPWWLVAGLFWPSPHHSHDCLRWFQHQQEQPFSAQTGQGARHLLCHMLGCCYPFCQHDLSLLLFVLLSCLCSPQFSGQCPASGDSWWGWQGKWVHHPPNTQQKTLPKQKQPINNNQPWFEWVVSWRGWDSRWRDGGQGKQQRDWKRGWPVAEARTSKV